MAIEREPPKASLSPSKPTQESRSSQPGIQFGQPSPLRSNLPGIQKQSDSIWRSAAAPKTTEAKGNRSGNSSHPLLLQPATSYDPRVARGEIQAYNDHASKNGDGEPIPIPLDGPLPKTIQALPQPTYTAYGQEYQYARVANTGMRAVSNLIDLTGDGWNGLGDDQLDPGDALQFIDSAQATESIKALLQGAVEDEDDKPRTRARKKKLKVSPQNPTAELNKSSVGDNESDIQGVKNTKIKENAQPNKEQVEEEDDDDDEDDEDAGVVEGLSVRLLPHQVVGLSWMTDKEIGKRKNGVLPKGGILADDMGLGKTLQSLALILSNPPPSSVSSTEKEQRKLPSTLDKGTLVVAPLALIKQWEKEINEKVLPSHKLRVCVHHGPQRTKSSHSLKKYDVVITTYQVLVSEFGSSSGKSDGAGFGCFGLHWYRVILDEAHTIKNRNAKATQACYALRAQYRWCLTGTPMQNNLDELQSLIKFLRIKPYNDLAVWRAQITVPMKSGRGTVAIKRLQYYLKAFMKRRTKDILKEEGALSVGGKSSANNAPAFRITERKIEKVVADLSPQERKFYAHLEQRADHSLEQMMGGNKMNYASALVLLLRLRQACNHPELVTGRLSKDKDALDLLGGESQTRTGATRRLKSSQGEQMDDIADMFGGLSVQTRQCEICLNNLQKEEISGGVTVCAGCREDIDGLHQAPRRSSSKKHPVDLGGTSSTTIENNSDIQVVAEAKRQAKEVVSLDTSDEDNSDADEDDTVDLDDETSAKSKLTISTKIRHVLKLLHQESSKHKFIVFSQFTSMLDLIEPFLNRDGLIFTRYDGSMKNELREASLERLRNEERTRVLLCSLKCGSLGLNLTAASRVIILEPFWNPFIEEQAIDRVHRLNQTVDVVVYKITIKDTVEERILELQEKKRELANATIEGKAALKLSMKDIMQLFRRDAEHIPSNGPADSWLDMGKSRLMSSPSSVQVLDRDDDGSGRGRWAPSSNGRKERLHVEDSVYGRRW